MPKGPVATLYKDYVVEKGGDSDHYNPSYVKSDLDSPKLVMTLEVEGVGGELGDYVRSLS